MTPVQIKLTIISMLMEDENSNYDEVLSTAKEIYEWVMEGEGKPTHLKSIN